MQPWAGRDGAALTLVSPEEEPTLASIERIVGIRLERSRLSGFTDGRSEEHIRLMSEIARLRSPGRAHSERAIFSRYQATEAMIPRWVNIVRAVSSEGFGRIKYHTEVRRRLDSDRQFRRYFEQETTELPQFYVYLARKDLGPLWDWLPEGAMEHDPNAYLKSVIM